MEQLNKRNLKLLYIWTQHNNRIFWRTPIAAFFTLALPLFMMLLFGLIFSDVVLDEAAGFNLVEFFVPALAAFSVASATYTNLAVSISIHRDERILKRVHGTPLPSWVYLLSSVLSAVWIALLSSVLMLTVGILAFDVDVMFGQLHWMAIFFVAGVTVFSILGLGVAALIPSGKAAPAVTNATILPLAFISDVFIYSDSQPGWLGVVGEVFPLKNFTEGFRYSFDQSIQGEGLKNLGVLVLWGVAGAYLMLKYFVWVPKVEAVSASKENKIARKERAAVNE